MEHSRFGSVKTERISGTPEESGTFTISVTLEAQQEAGGNIDTISRTYTLIIAPVDEEEHPKPTIVSSFATGTVGTAYSASLTASNGTSPYTWSYSGTLPTGLSLSGSDTTTTGAKYTLSGIPEVAGTYTFIVGLKDIYHSGDPTTKSFTVTIGDVSYPEPIITGTLTATGIVDSLYTTSTLTATGGTSPYEWSCNEDDLPPGLSFSSLGNTYTLSGTPETVGTYNFKVNLKDQHHTVSQTYTINISSIMPTAPKISGTLATTGTVDSSYSSTLTAEEGTAPYTWSYSGNLPTGLSFPVNTVGETYTLSGTPKTADTYKFTVYLTDTNSIVASKEFSITISDPTPPPSNPKISGEFVSQGKISADYSSSVTAINGTEPYTWSYTGGRPTGLNFSASGNTYTLSGRPTTAGQYDFQITLTDANKNTETRNYSLTIDTDKSESPVIIKYDFLNGIRGEAHGDFVIAENGTGNIEWSYNGTIPPGLSLGVYTPIGISASDSSSKQYAVLKGVPTVEGLYTFALQARDQNGDARDKTFNMQVYSPDDTTKTNTVQDIEELKGVSMSTINNIVDNSSTTIYKDESVNINVKNTYNIGGDEHKSLFGGVSGSAGCGMGFGVVGLIVLGVALFSKRSR